MGNLPGGLTDFSPPFRASSGRASDCSPFKVGVVAPIKATDEAAINWRREMSDESSECIGANYCVESGCGNNIDRVSFSYLRSSAREPLIEREGKHPIACATSV